MTYTPPQDDPALALWSRCRPADLTLIAPALATAPVQVGRIAVALGLGVISKTLDPTISGLIKLSQAKYVIEVNNTDPDVRQRFTVGHEIAHYLLHKDQIDSDGITDSILYRSKLSSRQEVEANRLAAAILLPWDLVNAWHTTNYNCAPIAPNIDRIAEAFRVSRLAVGFRFGF